MIYTYDEHVAAFPDLDVATRQRLGVEPSGLPLNDDGKVGRARAAGCSWRRAPSMISSTPRSRWRG